MPIIRSREWIVRDKKATILDRRVKIRIDRIGLVGSFRGTLIFFITAFADLGSCDHRTGGNCLDERGEMTRAQLANFPAFLCSVKTRATPLSRPSITPLSRATAVESYPRIAIRGAAV